MKNSREKSGVFFNHNPICYHGNQRLDLAEFQTHPSSQVCYHYLQECKNEKDLIKKSREKVETLFFPL